MKLHPKAIFIGIVTDIVLSESSSLGLSIFGFNANYPSLYVWSLILGLIGVAAGGYVTSWKSKSSKVFNVIVFGIVEILIGLFIALFISMPLWFNVASFILIIPAALLGAYIATRVININRPY